MKESSLPILTGVQRLPGRGCFRISLSNQPGTLELLSCPVLLQQAWEPAPLSSHFSCAGTAVCVAEQGTRAANWRGPGAATLCRAEVAQRETSVGLWPSEIASEKEEDKRWYRSDTVQFLKDFWVLEMYLQFWSQQMLLRTSLVMFKA